MKEFIKKDVRKDANKRIQKKLEQMGIVVDRKELGLKGEYEYILKDQGSITKEMKNHKIDFEKLTDFYKGGHFEEQIKNFVREMKLFDLIEGSGQEDLAVEYTQWWRSVEIYFDSRKFSVTRQNKIKADVVIEKINELGFQKELEEIQIKQTSGEEEQNKQLKSIVQNVARKTEKKREEILKDLKERIDKIFEKEYIGYRKQQREYELEQIKQTNEAIQERLKVLGLKKDDPENYVETDELVSWMFTGHDFDLQALLGYYEKSGEKEMVVEVNKYIESFEFIRKIYGLDGIFLSAQYDETESELEVWVKVSHTEEPGMEAKWLNRAMRVLEEEGHEEVVQRLKLKKVFSVAEAFDEAKKNIILINLEKSKAQEVINTDLHKRITEIINQTFVEYREKFIG